MATAGTRALLFCMPEHGHLKRLLPLIDALSTSGVEVHAFVDARYAAAVAAHGGVFHDLFHNRPLQQADDRSTPVPCRYVTFAALFTESVVEEVAALGARLVIHDAFAVIGVPVAYRLGLPRVHVCAGHNLAPAPTRAALLEDPRVQLSEGCLRAVETLKRDYAMPDASPFSYIDCLSPRLNIICEPPQFLTDPERSAFEPCAFFGSLSPAALQPEIRQVWRLQGADRGERTLRIYASLGTVVWRYYADYAWSVLTALAGALAVRDDLTAIVGLGGQPCPPGPLRSKDDRLRVESYVDQWSVLAGADVFLTHHGLNSTHEAIWHGVPMLSCPFFSDQPGLARRCQELGLARPLTPELRAPVSAAAMLAAVDGLQAAGHCMADRLATARQWEAGVIAARPAVIARITGLI